MSDEERRILARAAGDGDLEAAKRLVWLLEREGRPPFKVKSGGWSGPCEHKMAHVDCSTAPSYEGGPRNGYYADNLAAMFDAICGVDELLRVFCNGDWFGEWRMKLSYHGADPERANQTPAQMVEEIRKNCIKTKTIYVGEGGGGGLED